MRLVWFFFFLTESNRMTGTIVSLQPLLMSFPLDIVLTHLNGPDQQTQKPFAEKCIQINVKSQNKQTKRIFHPDVVEQKKPQMQWNSLIFLVWFYSLAESNDVESVEKNVDYYTQHIKIVSVKNTLKSYILTYHSSFCWVVGVSSKIHKNGVSHMPTVI